MRFLMLLCLLVGYSPLMGQAFNEVTNQMNLYVPIGPALLGSGMSTYDVNDDGLEDLTFATNANGIYLFLNEGGTFGDPIIFENEGEAKAVLWADYDNDGDVDLFISHDGAPNRLLSNDGEENLTDVSLSSGIQDVPVGRSYGAAWCDTDRDGDLDLYVCNYDWFDGPGNWFFVNQGDGTFIEMADENEIQNEIQPSFMPSFSDYNGDMNPDLYVINDKTALNALFMSNGGNSFIDQSETSFTNIEVDAMSNSNVDFDRDGDIDIYISNNATGNKLLQNQGGSTFSEIAAEMEVDIQRFSWGALWFDANNNSYPDLFISTQTPVSNNSNPFFQNNNGSSFTPINAFSPGNFYASFSNSSLDYNGDGAIDIAQANDLASSVSLWQNTSDVGNYIRVELQGIASNRDGIGSWIHVYSGTALLEDFTKCGEGYLSQRSQYHHFGIGEQTEVDSIVVEWPSGWVDTFTDLNVNETHLLVEGSSLQVELPLDQQQWLCENDSIYLEVLGFDNYLWSTGEEESGIWVSEATEISLTVTSQEGFTFTSASYSILEAPELLYETSLQPPTCAGFNDGFIAFYSEAVDQFTWDQDFDSLSPSELGEGTYSLSMTDTIGCAYSFEFTLDDPELLELQLASFDLLCAGDNSGYIEVMSTGGTGEISIDGTIENLNAGEYEIIITDESGCTASATTSILSPEPIEIEFNVTHVIDGNLGSIEPTVSGGTPPFSFQWSNSSDEQNLENISEGTYIIYVTDSNGCLMSDQVSVDAIVGVFERNNSLYIFPNPASDVINLIGVEFGSTSLEIYSLLGELVYSSDHVPHSIDVSSLPPGHYTLLFQDIENRRSFHVIIR